MDNSHCNILWYYCTFDQINAALVCILYEYSVYWKIYSAVIFNFKQNRLNTKIYNIQAVMSCKKVQFV